MNVLLVDDEALARRRLRRLLSDAALSKDHAVGTTRQCIRR
jgi:YesN/AraC family two-component response regulator